MLRGALLFVGVRSAGGERARHAVLRVRPLNEPRKPVIVVCSRLAVASAVRRIAPPLGGAKSAALHDRHAPGAGVGRTLSSSPLSPPIRQLSLFPFCANALAAISRAKSQSQYASSVLLQTFRCECEATMAIRLPFDRLRGAERVKHCETIPARMPDYLLSWQNPRERLYDIAILFTAPAGTPRLLLPVWRPGRYLIQNYAANVREWGGSHRVWKDGKTSWRVDARAGEAVTVTYRYYAGVLDAGSSFLDDGEAYVNGTNLFMLVDGLRGEEHRLTLAAPAEWRIETQLPRDAATFVARDYDHLLDSPIIAAAELTRHTFTEAGARFHLVFRGDEGIDTERFVEPVRVIARTQAELFGGLPFSEYRFLCHVGERWHGVEHEDSCSILAKRAALLGTEGYDRF